MGPSSLIISLPANKASAWLTTIKNIITARQVKTKELESTIGRLTHLSLILPAVHHFISRIRELHTRAARNNQTSTKVPDPCVTNLELMLVFINKANQADPRLPIRFMYSGAGGILTQGICVAILLTRAPPVPSVEQPPQAHCRRHHAMGRHPGGAP